MPFDRRHITVPSQIMLPTYVIFFGVVGLNFAATGRPRLFGSPMLRYADQLMPIRLWGAVFLACSIIMLTAMLAGHRFWYRYGLMVCCISMIVWAAVAVAGIWVQPISYSAWAWPAAIAAACWASNKSLEDEQSPRREH